MGIDVNYNYQAQQRYAFLHSFTFTEYCFSLNVHLKQIEFELNVNLLNFLHFKLRIAFAQYAFEQEDEEIAHREQSEQLRKITTDRSPTDTSKSKIKGKIGKFVIGIIKWLSNYLSFTGVIRGRRCFSNL